MGLDAETILTEIEAEVGRYDFGAFAQAPGNRALMDTIVAMAMNPGSARDDVETLAGGRFLPSFDRLVEALRTEPSIQPGSESQNGPSAAGGCRGARNRGQFQRGSQERSA